MSQHIKRLPSFTFAAGSTVSNAISGFNDCRSVGMAVIDTTSTGTLTVQAEMTTGGSDWVDLQSGSTDIVVRASQGLVLEPVPFQQLRLLASATSTGTNVQVGGVIIV